MGDLPKPSDDGVWTEVERSFFASAPPDPPEPHREPPRLDEVFPTLPPPRPRRELLAHVRPFVAGTWRRTKLVLGVASAQLGRTARAGVAAFAALWALRIDRRRAVYVFAGAVVVAGLSAGIVAFRNRALTTVATAPREAPANAPEVAEAAPVTASNSRADSPPVTRSAPEVRSRHAGASNRLPRVHRKPAPAAAPAVRPVMAAYTDRETYWAHERQSAPVRGSRPFFSR
jgi:hypothetical protein